MSAYASGAKQPDAAAPACRRRMLGQRFPAVLRSMHAAVNSAFSQEKTAGKGKPRTHPPHVQIFFQRVSQPIQRGVRRPHRHGSLTLAPSAAQPVQERTAPGVVIEKSMAVGPPYRPSSSTLLQHPAVRAAVGARVQVRAHPPFPPSAESEARTSVLP